MTNATGTVQERQQSVGTSPLFRPRRVAHVNLWVGDVEKATAFYRDVAGVGEAYRRPQISSVFLSNNNTYHDLALMDVRRPGNERGPGLHHFALELETEVDLYNGYQRAKEVGHQFDYSLSADVAHSVYGSDPDGNVYEVYADVYADWRSRRSGVIGGAKPGWKPGDTPPVAEKCYPVDPDIQRNEDAVFHVRRTSHVALVVREFEATVRMYTETLGLTPIFGGAKSEFAVLGGTLGERSLSLFRATDGRTPGMHHFGMEVWDEDDLDRARTRLKAVGIEPAFEIDHPVRRCIFLRDPDQKLVQFYIDRTRSPDDLADVEENLALYLS